MEYCKGQLHAVLNKRRYVLQMPDSRPTAKQLESLLKDTDRTAVGLDDSIGGRTFMVMYVLPETL